MKNKLKKIGKFIIHNTFGFLVGILIAGTTVYAATVISGSSISYDNSNSTLDATNVQDALDELTSKTYQCPGRSYDLCAKDIKVGDYVTYAVPTTTYHYYTLTVPASMTGYDTEQTIKLGEGNLWRIIDIKNDGTIDMISEYTSSNPIYFKGLVGIKNFVGTLNWIANSAASGYSVDTRYMGYNGQVGTIRLEGDVHGYNWSVPNWSVPEEGDTGYKKDTELVQSALGTLKAYKYGTTEYVPYWLASRYSFSISSSGQMHGITGRVVDPDGNITHYGQDGYGGAGVLWSDSNGVAANPAGFAAYIRPITTIIGEAYVDHGDGTKSNPWYLD